MEMRRILTIPIALIFVAALIVSSGLTLLMPVGLMKTAAAPAIS